MRLIDADATIELFRSLGSRDYRRKEGTIADAMKMLLHDKYTPTIEAEPVKHGRWIPYSDRHAFAEECTVCGGGVEWDHGGDQHHYNYCPNCGAEMDSEG